MSSAIAFETGFHQGGKLEVGNIQLDLVPSVSSELILSSWPSMQRIDDRQVVYSAGSLDLKEETMKPRSGMYANIATRIYRSARWTRVSYVWYGIEIIMTLTRSIRQKQDYTKA